MIRAEVPHLLERDDAVCAIERCIDQAFGGTGSAVVLEGAAGLGKSSLVSVAMSLANDRGMNVLGARGIEIEEQFSFGVVRQLFERTVVSTTARDKRSLFSGAAGLASP